MEDTESIEKGYCRECGRMDAADKFEQVEQELLCCTKVISVHLGLHSILTFRTGNVSEPRGSSRLL